MNRPIYKMKLSYPELKDTLEGVSIVLLAISVPGGSPNLAILANPKGVFQSTTPDALTFTADASALLKVEKGKTIGGWMYNMDQHLAIRFVGKYMLEGNRAWVEKVDFASSEDVSAQFSFSTADANLKVYHPDFSSPTQTLSPADMALILQADIMLLGANSPIERPYGLEGPSLYMRTTSAGKIMAAHESLILFPLHQQDPILKEIVDFAGHASMTATFADSKTGNMLMVKGNVKVLKRTEHAGRFDKHQLAIAFTVKENILKSSHWPISFSQPSHKEDSQALYWQNSSPIRTYRSNKILSVNVSMPQKFKYKNQDIWTGFFKEPVPPFQRVKLSRLNLEGDGQADRWGHGGAFKAAYIYPIEYYDYWAQRLNRRDFSYGQFGENLTVQGMLDDLVHVGDIYRIGTATVEVSQPRVPCFKLAFKMGIEGFENTFLRANRTGHYVRVLEEGELGVGDAIELLHRVPDSPTIADVTRIYYFDQDDMEGAYKVFSAPALSHGWKDGLEERLLRNGVLD